MKLTENILKALNFSADKHFGQKRKSSKLPYIVHPFSVAIILSNYTSDEEIIMAGLLHDVIEDVEGCGYEDLRRDFGERVADIVQGISENKKAYDGMSDKESWQDRKEEYLENLKGDSSESLLVCAADKIHNLRSMIMIYKDQGDAMWSDYNAPLERQIWYYDKALKILKEKLDSEIVGELEEAFEKFKKVMDK